MNYLIYCGKGVFALMLFFDKFKLNATVYIQETNDEQNVLDIAN